MGRKDLEGEVQPDLHVVNLKPKAKHRLSLPPRKSMLPACTTQSKRALQEDLPCG